MIVKRKRLILSTWYQEEQNSVRLKLIFNRGEINKATSKTDDPGRTPGKAEGSREIVERDLEKNKKMTDIRFLFGNFEHF